jgi:putative transposase
MHDGSKSSRLFRQHRHMPKEDDHAWMIEKPRRAIIYILCTGIQWNALQKELGACSTVHDRFQEWEKKGFFKALWQLGLAEYDEVQGIEWEWQSVDGAGIALTVVVDGANRHDSKLLYATLDDIVIVRPEPSEEHPQYLCLDAGYDYPLTRVLVRARGYLDHIRSRGDEKQNKATIPG